ncbi:hypothetical protein S7335_4832 [Synechococcus sp. PCC 7335]|uniref:hypothetical protein n=1 Tax=Synechococcus sp. (strain ATCC 29403 / PCC 7335) TaxID=91464 RepID=UPI00017EC050|nr:hypothetical protein [Synechococcus sp. PCC 7335]EDX87125.1 hypothetical protein S7335_4832 [Synechococcus sp. PCC 7335]
MAHHERVPVLAIVALIACAIPTKLTTVFNQTLPALSQTTPIQAEASNQLVDAEGNLINSAGFLVNAEGDLIDTSGNLLTEGTEGVLGAELEPGETAGDVAIPTIVPAIDSDVESSGASDPLAERGRWWWLLVPLAGLALLIWAAAKRTDDEEVSDTLGTDLDLDQSDRIISGFDSGITHDLTPDAGSVHPEVPKPGIPITAAPESGADSGPVVEKPVEEKLSADTVIVDSEQYETKSGRTTNAKTLRPVTFGSADIQGASSVGAQDVSTPIKSPALDSSVNSIHGDMLNASNVPQSGAYKSEAESIDFDSKGTVGEDLGRSRSEIRESASPVDSSENWLQRAKQRINEATEQMKQTAAEIQDDVTKAD